MSGEKDSDKDLEHFWALSQAGINADQSVMNAFLKMNFFADKKEPNSSSPDLQSDPTLKNKQP